MTEHINTEGNNASAPDPDRETLIQDLNRQHDLQLAERLSASELEDLLTQRLNNLIRADFNAVVTILYRVDVNETKLRQLLKSHPEEDAGRIMARLIIERQSQKIKTRRAGI